MLPPCVVRINVHMHLPLGEGKVHVDNQRGKKQHENAEKEKNL